MRDPVIGARIGQPPRAGTAANATRARTPRQTPAQHPHRSVPRRLASVQALRGVAVLLVVLFHASAAFGLPKYFAVDPLHGFTRFGYAGVDLFFVISGFIIAHVHTADVGHPRRFRVYVFKRIARIYPAYWMALSLVSIAALVADTWQKVVPSSLPVLVETLALIPQSPATVGGTGAPILAVAWTLQYEMAFYAVFSVFVLSRALGASVVMCVAGAVLVYHQHPLAAFASNPLLLEFPMGVSVYWLSRRAVPRCCAYAGLAIGLALFALCAMVDLRLEPLGGTPGELGYGLAGALVVWAAVALETEIGPSLPASLLALGDASYSIYLVHFPAIAMACKSMLALSRHLYVPAMHLYLTIVVAAVTAGFLFHRVVEVPLARAMAVHRGMTRP
jgi:peptidoglycan/LPS O-acetylase OafA/YrhL